MEKNITKKFESLNISSNGSQSISTDKKESKKLVCSDSECTETPDLRENSLQCYGCERYVHYHCTNMPAYMIEYFIKKTAGKRKKWLCIMCIHVSSEIAEATKRPNTERKQREIIEKLRREVAACDNVAKAQQDKIRQQKEEIDHLKNHVKSLGSKMKEMDENISKSMTINFKNLEAKIETVINNQTSTLTMTTEKTFANVVKNNQTNSTPNIKNIIKETQAEQNREEHEKKKRETNIVVHGVPEYNHTSEEEENNWNTDYAKKLMTDLKIDDKTKNAIRIGKPQEEKNRPIKIFLTNLADKENVMANLKNLKGIDKYKGISITNDYTFTQRRIIKEWTQKAKERNEKEPTDSKVVWRVRGSPEKNIYLKKFVLSNQTSNNGYDDN